MKPQNKFKQTEIGKIPEDWEEESAEKFCIKVADGTHDSPKKKDEGKYLITSRHLTDGSLDFNNAYKISEEDFLEINKRSGVSQWDVIFGMIGTIGEVYLEKNKNIDYAIKNVGLFKSGSEIKGKWLVYFFKSKEAKEYIFGRRMGTTQEYLTLESLRKFPIIYPKDRLEMQKIVNILDSVQQKIELNQKMNKTLEAIGQALFKRLFVDFEFPNEQGKPYKSSGGEMVESELGMIPKGWKVSTIGNEFKTVLGGTPDRTNPEYWGGNVPWVNSGKVNEFRIIEPSEFITNKGLENSATKLMPEGTVVLAITGATLGQVSRLEIQSCANQSVVGILENDKLKSEYIYFWIKNKIHDMITHQTGGAQQHINKNNVDNYNILIPDEDLLTIYIRLVKKLFDSVSINCFESQNLSKIRDALLPKLMSGEIRVKI